MESEDSARGTGKVIGSCKGCAISIFMLGFVCECIDPCSYMAYSIL